MAPLGLSRLALHTQTFRPWSLATCVERFAAAGIGGISVWRHTLAELGLEASARLLHSSGLKIPALVRGGFFCAQDTVERSRALDDNRRAIDEAAAIGAEMVVLVVGAQPGLPLAEARAQVAEGLSAVLPHARQCGVKLAVEPMHPMYAADKSCINRLADARALCEALGDPAIGVAVDAYHVWWDPDLEREIARCGAQGLLFGYHVCDWRVDTRHLLTDRGLPGEGCIDLNHLRRAVEAAGFTGPVELEVFSEHHWARDQDEFLAEAIRATLDHC